MGIKEMLAVVAATLLAGIAWSQESDSNPVPIVTPDEVHPQWAGFMPEFQTIICPFGLPGNYDTDEIQCGYVLVPEDRTHAESRLIQLAVLKIKSTSDTPPGGAMIRLTGGPGSPSLSAGRVNAYRGSANAGVRATADLIFFDQRGTGYSEGRFCRGALQAYQFGVPTTPDGVALYLEERQRCLAEARARGVFVDGYTNWQNALDVRDIRRALGYEQWTVFGVSYGTELGQAVMEFDPDGVRAAILDSVVPAGLRTNSTSTMLGNGFRSALDAVDAMCAADRACQRAYGDRISDRMLAAMRAYDESPLTLTGLNINRAVSGTLYMDGSLAGSALFQALYSRSFYGDLPAFLSVLETRDTVALRAYVNQIAYPIDHDYGYGMAYTINCRAGMRQTPGAPPPPGPNGSDLADLIGGAGSFQICGDGYSTSPDPSVKSLISDIPTLVVTGAVDPITPPYYADILIEGLSNGQRVDFPNTGHGGLLSNWESCGRGLLTAFIIDPEAPLDASCAGETPGPNFLINLRETKAPYRFGLGLQAGNYTPTTVAAAAGLLMIMVSFLLTPIARMIDRSKSANYGLARSLTWLGGALSLGGVALAIQTILRTAQSNPASLVVGVPASIAWAGWLGLAGMVVCLIALWRMVAAGDGTQTLGTRAAIVLAALLSGSLLWFLISIGAGPV
ncbi:MAG: alpha/beta fold hydrolase [Pseudomonadota bacterium]